jgi:hypothetical protein
MTKKKQSIEYEDPDPFDGMKAVGCLLVGVVILIAMLSISYFVISNLRTT